MSAVLSWRKARERSENQINNHWIESDSLNSLSLNVASQNGSWSRKQTLSPLTGWRRVVFHKVEKEEEATPVSNQMDTPQRNCQRPELSSGSGALFFIAVFHGWGWDHSRIFGLQHVCRVSAWIFWVHDERHCRFGWQSHSKLSGKVHFSSSSLYTHAMRKCVVGALIDL